MKNGYYVSAYCCIDEEGCVLNAQIRHDQAIALWLMQNGMLSLINYWELERYTRKKQHMQPFLNKEHFLIVLNDLLNENGLTTEDIIGIWGMPEFEDNHNIETHFKQYKVPLHSIYHIFSALINTKVQFSERCLVLALDGGPDNVSDRGFDTAKHYGAALFENGRLIGLQSISSPAYIWAEASDKFNMREGTLMALAEACLCECKNVRMDITSFKSMWDIPLMRVEFERVWSIIEQAELKLDGRFSEEENKISCFMKIIQTTSRNIVQSELLRLIEEYQINPNKTVLSVVGGFALNCPTNTWIMNHFKFKQFIAPPCVNDSGIALGIGLLHFYQEYGSNLQFLFESPFYGHKEKHECFEELLIRYGQYINRIDEFNIDVFIKDLSNDPVCWFEGECEIGPRALGHRSILSAANSIIMKDKLNKIKQREWWRPVAPIVLEEVVDDWFTPAVESPFMLHAVEVLESKRVRIPAVLHLNNTARIQTIGEENFFHRILLEYYRITGIPMLCNTSLNDRGEPIINNYDELMNFALRKRIPVIYIEQRRVELINHSDYAEDVPSKSTNKFDEYMREHADIFEKYIGINVDDEELDFYINHKSYFSGSLITLTLKEFRENIQKVRRYIYENLSD